MSAVAVGFVVYLAVILVVGFLTSRLNKTLPDYLIAGRRLGPWVVAFSERASGESAWLLLGVTGLAYVSGLGDPSGTQGIPAFWTAVGTYCGLVLAWTLVAGKLREASDRLGTFTIPRYFEARFGKRDPVLRLTASAIITFCFVFYVAAQFDAAGKALEETFGWPHLYGVLVGVAIILFYTGMGGFFAVAWTDLVQGWLMLITLAALPLFAIFGPAIGGWEAFTTEVSAIDPALLSPNGGRTGWTLWAGILGGFGIGLGFLGQPHLVVRYMSIRSREEIKPARVIALVWGVFGYGGAVLMGLTALVIFGAGQFEDPDKMMPALASEVFPGWLAGILICGALAAMMSTADSQLLVTSSAITEDFYRQEIARDVSPQKLVCLGRLVTVGAGLVSLGLSFLPGSIFDKVLFAWAGLGAAFGPGLVLSLWWSGTTRNGVFTGMIVGLGTVLVWNNFPGVSASIGAEGLYELVPAFFIATLTVVTVSLLTQKRGDD